METAAKSSQPSDIWKRHSPSLDRARDSGEPYPSSLLSCTIPPLATARRRAIDKTSEHGGIRSHPRALADQGCEEDGRPVRRRVRAMAKVHDGGGCEALDVERRLDNRLRPRVRHHHVRRHASGLSQRGCVLSHRSLSSSSSIRVVYVSHQPRPSVAMTSARRPRSNVIKIGPL